MQIIKQVEITIHGQVQGVFFRTNIRKWAELLELRGYVQNCGDGTVYVIAQGIQSNLEKLLRRCYSGPKYAKVKKVECTRSEASNIYSSFKVKSLVKK